MNRYNIQNLKKAIRNPRLIMDEAGRLIRPQELKIINLYFKSQTELEPLDVIEQDWDNLIILDACRFDYFKKQNHIDGILNKVLSGGGESWEFMNHNFIRRELHDTVYITANPHVDRIPDDTFYYIENTLDRWNSEIEVVHPKEVASAATEAHSAHPNKRLIIHFMQPHTPWLGPTAERIREKYEIRGNNPNHGKKKLGHETSDPRTGDTGWFGLVRQGEITYQTMEQAYSETLDIVLDHTEDLIKEIPGKSVITADHGEMLGERVFISRLWGHYNSIWTRHLRNVPWLEIEADERRDIVEEEPLDRDRIDENVVEKRLQALGYQ
jgi:hypothetical protein